MEYLTLGNTDLMMSRTALELIELDEKKEMDAYSVLLQEAYEAGVNFFAVNAHHELTLKTLGLTFTKLRPDVKFCVFSNAMTAEALKNDISTCLDNLQTNSIEVLSLGFVNNILIPNDPDGLYEAVLEAQKSGKVKYIALRVSSVNQVRAAAISGVCNFVFYNFSASSDENDESLVALCENMEIGFIALNPAGKENLINIPLAFGYINQFENVVALWKLNTEENLKQILYFSAHPPILDEKFKEELLAFRS